jgi:hypothetical protein
MSSEDHFSAPLEDGLLVARPADDRLFLFNGTARFIWERLVEGIAESDLPAVIAAHYGINLAQAHKDFNDTLQYWRDYGLIRPLGERRRYETAGLAFDIHYGDSAIANVLLPMLAPLESAAACQAALDIDLDRHDGAIVLRVNGVEIGRANDIDAIIEPLFYQLFRWMTEKTDWAMSLHAAAVGTAGSCVLMPGASGVGKSSLAAALMSLEGTQFGADDLVLLTGVRLEVIPAALPIVLKRASWDAVHPFLPDLAGHATYRRLGRECRYWTPPRERIARAPMPVTAVVFPRYIEGAETSLVPLSPLDACARITTAPSAVRPPITGDTLETLATFVRNMPAYCLTYGMLAEATRTVRGLMLT